MTTKVLTEGQGQVDYSRVWVSRNVITCKREGSAVTKLTLDVPTELKAILERHPEIQWEQVAEKALWNYARKVQLADQVTSRSTLSEIAAESIGRKVKIGLRRRYSKTTR